MTHTGAYSKIYDCDSVFKREAKAPAKRLNDKKQAVLWKCVTWPDICGSHVKAGHRDKVIRREHNENIYG